jgi:hypothetical protein
VVLVALPDVLGATYTVQPSPPFPNGEIDLLLLAAASVDITLSAPFAGTVVATHAQGRISNWVEIQQGKWNVAVLVSNSVVLVRVGEIVQLGTPIASASYKPDDPLQLAFETAGSNKPRGTIVLIGVKDMTAGSGRGFGQLTLDTVIKDPAGNVLTVPLLGPGLTAPIVVLSAPIPPATGR